MAVNPNENRKNKHFQFLGTSGSGKTWKVKKMLRESKNANILAFDPVAVYGDVLEYVDDIKELVKKVTRSIEGGEKYRYAFRGRPDDYNDFCELVWLCGDGNNELLFINEEAGGYLGNSAPTSERWYDIITIGRKYGIAMITVAQRPQSLNKTVYDESPYAFIGHCKGKAGEYVEREFKLDMSLVGFETYNYYLANNEGVKLMDKNDKEIKTAKKK